MVKLFRHHLTPRRLVAGLLIFMGACHKAPPVAKPAPAPVREPPKPVGITDGPSLIAAMRTRYPNWYRTLTFIQKTTVTGASGNEIVSTWYEAGTVPGRLRIDTDLASKSGTLFARDSVFAFNAGKLVRSDAGLNELLVLGFDVYRQPESKTEAQLRSRGFDLTRLHEGMWQGRTVYVVGAVRGDTTAKQFWIDKERLLFVRLIEGSPQGRADVRFEQYQPLGGGWIAAEVVQLVNGKRRLREEYSSIRADVPLSDALFDPAQWTTAPHWAK
jgi:hypothetical protein